MQAIKRSDKMFTIMIIKILLVLIQLLSQGNKLQTKVESILKKSISKNSIYSVTCYSTNQKKFIVEINSDVPFIPASTNKLITTGTALFNLGINFTINTEIYTDDMNLNDGIINGNIYFKGKGDPTITTATLDSLIRSIKKQSIYKITGDIIIDDTFFEETFERNEWIEDENISVPLPPISSVTVNYNSITLKVTGSKKINQKAFVEGSEDSGYFTIVNKTKTSNRTTRLLAVSNFTGSGETITITGTIRKNFTRYLRVHIKNSAAYTGHLVASLIKKQNIQFNGKIKKGSIPKLVNLIAMNKTPLIEFLKPINKNSNNFYAEHLFLIIGGEYSGGYGSPFDASQAINSFLKSIHIYNKDFNIVDGSGISRKNSISTRMLVNFLNHIYLTPGIFNEYYNSLSIPQIDGTLQNRMSSLFPPDRMRAKTGTLNGVVSLAGYVVSKSGDLLIFAINFNYSKGNTYKLRQIQDDIITLIADSY